LAGVLGLQFLENYLPKMLLYTEAQKSDLLLPPTSTAAAAGMGGNRFAI
jgi:hypothetical protein